LPIFSLLNQKHDTLQPYDPYNVKNDTYLMQTPVLAFCAHDRIPFRIKYRASGA